VPASDTLPLPARRPGRRVSISPNTMQERHISVGPVEILADAGIDQAWTAEHFSAGYWQRKGRLLTSAAGGRGAVAIVSANGEQWAIRPYLRGGMARHLSRNRYVWQGSTRVRSIREWRLISRLFEAGLPVPRPVAAAYRRTGLSYTASIITRRIETARPLAEHLQERSLDEAAWRSLGACVRRFHDAGVWHADLTAHNLLLDADGAPWLLDFDRGRLRAPGSWKQANLDRLLRSLRKISTQTPATQFAPINWLSLLEGYSQMSA